VAELTTLNAVKAWLNVPTSGDDVLLTRLVQQVSRATLNYLSRPLLTRQRNVELRDGSNGVKLMLRNWPVVSVSSLIVNGITIPAASSMTSTGYTLVPWDGTAAGTMQQIILQGYTFTRGVANVQITYDSGYCVVDQAATVSSSSYQVSFTPTEGNWCQDDGVTLADGTVLTKITGTPASGEYSVTPNGVGGVTYQFNAAQVGASVLVSYSYVPADLEQGVIEWVGERYRYRDRIGQSSKSLGGDETAAYNLKGVPEYLMQVFEPYKKFLPL
jgi:hypothetical protein